MSNLIGIDALAVVLGTTASGIREIAARDQNLDLSWTTELGYCIHRRDLPAWKVAARQAQTACCSGE